MQRDFLGESHPPTGERPEGVLGGRDGRVDGALWVSNSEFGR